MINWEEIRDKLFRYFLVCCENWQDAEDITQGAIEKILNKFNEYDSSFSFENWAIKVAKNYYIDECRREKITIDYCDLNNFAIKEKVVVRPSNINKSIRLIKNENQRTVLMLRYYGLSYQDISDSTGININTAKVEVLRAKKEFKKLYA